jgi:phosphoribosyl 1,2-cyclic phosphodiesterase
MIKRRPEDYSPRLRVRSLASGSRGNCHLIRSATANVLIDAGISARRIETFLRGLGLSVGDLDGIILTHEHQDHSAGLRVLTGKYPVPVYTTELTRDALGTSLPDPARVILIQSGKSFQIKDLGVEPFSVPHDAYDPVGMVVECGSVRLGLATDLGYVTSLIRDRLSNCHGLILEANYDEVMLREDSKRPWSVKQRISARHGHLSNRKAAALAGEIGWEGLKWICLGHLSEDCNDPARAVECVQSGLREKGFGRVQVAAIGARGHDDDWIL